MWLFDDVHVINTLMCISGLYPFFFFFNLFICLYQLYLDFPSMHYCYHSYTKHDRQVHSCSSFHVIVNLLYSYMSRALCQNNAILRFISASLIDNMKHHFLSL